MDTITLNIQTYIINVVVLLRRANVYFYYIYRIGMVLNEFVFISRTREYYAAKRNNNIIYNICNKHDNNDIPRMFTYVDRWVYLRVFMICVQIFIADIKNSDEYFFFFEIFYFLIENHPSRNKQSLSI